MAAAQARRILVVANRTAGTPTLLNEVGRRVHEGACTFALLIPDAPDQAEGNWTLETALPRLESAAKGEVAGLVGGSDPFESVRSAVHESEYDEIIVSTLSPRLSRWLRNDLPRRIERLGLPVTVVSGEADIDEESKIVSTPGAVR